MARKPSTELEFLPRAGVSPGLPHRYSAAMKSPGTGRRNGNKNSKTMNTKETALAPVFALMLALALSWESEELDERPQSLFLTAGR